MGRAPAQLAPLLLRQVLCDVQLRLREHLPDAGAVVVLVDGDVVVELSQQ